MIKKEIAEWRWEGGGGIDDYIGLGTIKTKIQEAISEKNEGHKQLIEDVADDICKMPTIRVNWNVYINYMDT